MPFAWLYSPVRMTERLALQLAEVPRGQLLSVTRVGKSRVLNGQGPAGYPKREAEGEGAWRMPLGQAYDDIVRDALQIKRVSYPDDVKGTAAFLASPDSDYMTGQMIHIDGGWCIQ